MQTPTGKRLASALVAALSVATLTAFAVAPLTEKPLPPSQRIIEPVPLSPQALGTDGEFLRQTVVSRGESLGSLFRKLGDQDRELMDFIRTDVTARKLLRLQAGTTVRAQVNSQNQIQSLSYPLDGDPDHAPMRLEVDRENGRWHAVVVPMLLDRTLVTRTATINSSLFAATDEAGIPDAITARIPEIFATDMDFHRHVSKGDKVRVVYETFTDPQTLADGQPGKLLAVEYQSRTKRLEAVWFEREDSSGEGDFYTFDGRTLSKAFLQSPMEFTRISSGFTLGRRHPVFRDWRAHKGIDYAAPAGTKIRTIGDGVVEFVGPQRGYGNVVIVKHDKERSTLYAHMSKFASKLTEGAEVARGQVIGHVGQTGWASGPHLHFEFLVNGEPSDPEAVLPPPEPPLDLQALSRFRDSTGEVLQRLRWEASDQLAAFE